MQATEAISCSMARFIDDQIYSLTLMATSQRSHIYSEGSSEDTKKQFRKDLRQQLEYLAKKYSNPIATEQHLQNIANLSKDLSARHEKCLNRGRFRIGLAQKALNLYLKYLWCLDRISEPPHCPIDRIVLENAKWRSEPTNWTDIDSIADYSKIVQHIFEVASKREQSLATWELEIWAVARERSQGEPQVGL